MKAWIIVRQTKKGPKPVSKRYFDREKVKARKKLFEDVYKNKGEKFDILLVDGNSHLADKVDKE